MTIASTRRARAALEIALMALWLASFIWLWARAFPGAFYVCLAGYVLLIESGRRAAGESLRDAGFRLDTAGAALVRVAVVVAVFGGGAFVAGRALGSLAFPPLKTWPAQLGWGVLWGLAQQVGLLAFFYRRFVDVLRRPGLAAPAAGLTFALFHLPNPFLTALTAVVGTLAALIYQRAPNLWVSGAAHALTSWLVSRSLPAGITHLMRVGPGFWSAAS